MNWPARHDLVVDWAVKLPTQNHKATHKIWSTLANWLQRYSSLKVWTATTDGRRTIGSHCEPRWAFGSGELKTKGPLVLYRSPECWWYVELEQTWKYKSTQCCISFHPCRSIRKQIWPCHKNGQGHMKTFAVLEYLMLYTKFQGNQPLGYEEEDFVSFSPYMGMVMWPGRF